MKNFAPIVLLLIPLLFSSCAKTDNQSNQELSAIYHALTDLYSTTDVLASVSYEDIDSTSTKIQVSGDVFLSNFRKSKTFNTSSGAVEGRDSVNLMVVFTAPDSKDTLYIPCQINSLKYYKKDYDEYSGVWMQLFDGINYIDLTAYNKNGIYYRSLSGEGGVSISTVVKNYEAK
ncbi:MAG: hypothetical protein P4L28_03670 [Paludibacteraceae bacterium]|nr:hypothetical protein [Paludibacteraceae bacterium]